MSNYITINGENIDKSETELTLTIDNPDVEEISDSIGELTNLIKLTMYLDESVIKHIPSVIGNLVKLEELNIFFNDYITTLPESISNLKNLKVLYLGIGNGFTTLPDNITDLNLNRLYISDFPNLVYFPKLKGGLLNLEHLEIHSIGLSELDPDIGNMLFLEELRIEYTEITTLPDKICNLKRLKKLSLAGNNLKSLPSCIGNLTSLEYLDLRNNSLTELPDSFGDLNKLVVLELDTKSTIKYTTFPRGLYLENFPNLVREDVEMDDNYVEEIEKIGKNINFLNAHGSNLQSKFTLPTNLTIINLVEIGDTNYGILIETLKKLPEKTLRFLSLPQNNHRLTSYLKNNTHGKISDDVLIQSHAPGTEMHDMGLRFNGTYDSGDTFNVGIYSVYSKYANEPSLSFDPSKYISYLTSPYDPSSPITQFLLDRFNVDGSKESEYNVKLLAYLKSKAKPGIANYSFLDVRLSELIQNNLIPPGILFVGACRGLNKVQEDVVKAKAKEERKWFRSRIHAMHEGVLSCSGPESKSFASPDEFCRVSGFHSCKEDGYCSTCADDTAIVVNSKDAYTTCFTADEIKTLFDKNPSQKIEGGFVRNPYFPDQTISSDYYAFANGKIPPFTKFRELLTTKSNYLKTKKEFIRIVDEYIIPIKQLGGQKLINDLYQYMLGIYNSYNLQGERIGMLMQKVLTEVYNTGDYNIDYDAPKIYINNK